jgi:hypothetical protein
MLIIVTILFAAPTLVPGYLTPINQGKNMGKIFDTAKWREIFATYLTLLNGGKYWQHICHC